MLDGTLMERYLQEETKTLVGPIYHVNPPNYGFTAMYQSHHPLTWSSQSRTSHESGGLSPPAESDNMYDGTQGPATPDLLASSPPYDSKSSTQQWQGLYPHHAQFAVAYIPRVDFINPSDIAPEQNFGIPAPEVSDDVQLCLPGIHPESADDSAIDPELFSDCLEHKVPSLASQAKRVSESTRNESTVPQVSRPETSGPSALVSKSRQQRRTIKASKQSTAQTLKSTRNIKSATATSRKVEKPVHRNAGPGPCTFCGKTLPTALELQKHVQSAHRHPFTCVFHYAGCTSTFSAKNEWKRHVLSQHLGLHYWHCTLDHCSQANPLHAHGRSPAPGIPPVGSIFNRKDLYTQHVRRMHLSHDGSKRAAQHAEERLKYYQEVARKQRCELPAYMQCPAVGCRKEFHGANAWDERMEHVACHLGRAASGKEPDVSFGGDQDPTLTNWAVSAEVGVTVPLASGGWQHRNPLKGTAAGGGTAASWRAAVSRMSSDEAEGDDSRL